MIKVLKALGSEPIGGKQETLYLLMAAAGLMSAFAPMAAMIDSLPTPLRVTLRVGLLAAAAYAGFKVGYSVLQKDRRQFLLPTSCQVESSDPPERQQHSPGLLLGYTTDDGSPIYVSDEDLTRHGIIVGQTGMGKSVFGKTLMFQQIQRGGGLLFIDGKLDEDNIQDIYEFCAASGRSSDFLVINPGRPEASNTYNPILFGDPDEVAARIISLIPSTSTSAGADFYKSSSALALVCFISALQESTQDQVDAWIKECKGKGLPEGYVDNNRVTGVAYNFLDLALLTMNEGVLGSLLQHVQLSSPDSLTRKNLSIFLEQYARENTGFGQATQPGTLGIDLKRLKETLGGIGARMHQFGSGRFGPVLNSYTPEVKLYDAIRDSKIVYVALPTMGKDVAAQNLGKIVIADLRTAISWLQMNKQDRPKTPFLAFLDEMSSYSTETLAVMFEQARSARVALLPAIQTDSGLSNISEDFKERIMSNTELKIFFRLSSQDTATTASDLIGMTKRVASTETSSEGSSASAQAMSIGPNKNLSDSAGTSLGDREQEEPLVHPDQIKALAPGECIVLRSPKVWNIRVPLIELNQDLKKAIGPLRINHSRISISKDQSFDAIGRVDQYIKEAQSRRNAPKPKKEKSPSQNRESAAPGSLEDLFSGASHDLPND
ncbi:MAG: type IV secretory system conjugative DNA transfer family protein [Limnohabitans sp.]|jgi:intracellular multiplication protein IcmO|uniref:type IV secretory system conjugative DNA transfer family protein n=1 Tax=Limnohabitans sp. TaxID=1907725 RepID=UPI00391CCEA2